MKSEKHFLDPDITLHSLAKMLELKPALVSQSLNQVIKRNFFDYINKQRIEYACHLLKTYTSKEKNITEISTHWIIPYQSKRYIESGDAQNAVSGIAPYAIDKKTGKIDPKIDTSWM